MITETDHCKQLISYRKQLVSTVEIFMPSWEISIALNRSTYVYVRRPSYDSDAMVASVSYIQCIGPSRKAVRRLLWYAVLSAVMAILHTLTANCYGAYTKSLLDDRCIRVWTAGIFI